MTLFRTTAVAAIFTCAIILSAAVTLSSQNAQDDMDRSIKPGDDFYHYANGGWVKTAAIPAGQPVTTHAP
ncbi:MAG TPA: hypothetical protein VGN44_16300 [Candidatus Angelobacter sp.]